MMKTVKIAPLSVDLDITKKNKGKNHHNIICNLILIVGGTETDRLAKSACLISIASGPKKPCMEQN